MKLQSINPATDQVSFETDCWSKDKLLEVADQVCSAQPAWAALSLQERLQLIIKCGQLLKEQRDELAKLISMEMGKVICESHAELDKCIFTCEYYAEHAEQFLADETIQSDASRSYVSYEAIGTVLGIMPWNFPFWQVFRFAIPALTTGNTVMLKHASNVPQCAHAAEQLFIDAGFPDNVYRNLVINSSQLEPLYTENRIRGIALTGSKESGRIVAQQAGKNLKHVVLELGGSDAFIVLDDADIESAVLAALASRFFTSGQSCINAKRIILVKSIANEFLRHFTRAVEQLTIGDPMDLRTKVGPMVNHKLRDKLHQQVTQSIEMGAFAVTGCKPVNGPGIFYQASILDNVAKGMPAYDEELFGPVAAILHAENEEHAIQLANDTEYGLGASVWTRDSRRGEQIARQVQSGMVFVNGLVKSDPRLPFGGFKNSGIGRELGRHGMLEFANAKTIWVG